jgi:hypothetical protein
MPTAPNSREGVYEVLSEMTGLNKDQIQDSMTLEDLGIKGYCAMHSLADRLLVKGCFASVQVHANETIHDLIDEVTTQRAPFAY